MADNIFSQQFWDDDEESLWDDIAALMVSAYLQGVDSGVGALPKNIQVLTNWDRINTAALEFAKTYRYTWIRGITDTSRAQTQKAVTDWISSGSPLDALTSALEPIFGPDRAERISVTETTRVFAQGNMDTWESTGLVDSATWMTAQDELVCPVCSDLDGTEIGIGDLDSAPPAHPSCRCYLQANVSEDALANQLDEILQ